MSDEIDDLMAQLNDPAPPQPESELPAPVVPAQLLPLAPPPPAPASPQVTVVVPPAATVEPPPLDLNRVVERHFAMSDELLSTWRYDRQELQQAANLVRDQIEHIRGSGGNPPSTMYEMYIKALDVKAATNATAVKLMDSTNKLIAATRTGTGPGAQTNNITVGVSGELIGILGSPPNPEDP